MLAATNQVWLKCVKSKQLVANFPIEATLGEEVARNEPVFQKCERKPQSQLVKVGKHCLRLVFKYIHSSNLN